MTKYDVFISCKSEDYKYAEEIYDFLIDCGINTFLASKELRRLGESEYRRAISKALRDAYHLIVFASKPEYIESTWVEYEWDMFVNAKLKGKKSGNILTILKGISTDDIPMDLWKYESFQFDDYQNRILQYVETPESMARSKEQRIREENDLRKRREEEAKAARRKELMTKLTDTAEEYKKAVAALQVDIDKINSLLEELDINSRLCPICRNSNPVSVSVCGTCGWPISPLEGLPELEYLNSDSDHIQQLYFRIYTDYVNLKPGSDNFIAKDKRINELEETVKLLKDEISSLKNYPKDSAKHTDAHLSVKDGFSVWVTFCPVRAERIIKEYQPNFDLQTMRDNMSTKRPFFVALFSSISDAEALKTRLESVGATVMIRSYSKSQRATNINPVKLQSKVCLNNMACVQINSCDRAIGEVAELLTLYFGRSKSSFKSILQTLPYTTPCSLSIEQAQELSSKLKLLGASAIPIYV